METTETNRRLLELSQSEPIRCVTTALKGRPGTTYQGRSMTAARAVWTMTHGDPGRLHVLHACGNERCVNVQHLYAGTQSQNMFDRVRDDHKYTKLTDRQIDEIRSRYAGGGVSYRDLAREYRVDFGTIGRIIRGRRTCAP